MRASFARGVFCSFVAIVALAAMNAQAATTIAYWQFDEKAPGNVVDFTAGAILDSGDAGTHDGTALGGDPFNDPDVNIWPRYVNGATGSADSALQMTLQDRPDTAPNSYVGEEEDGVYVADSGDFTMDLTSSTIYTIDAVIRMPDPVTIMGANYDVDMTKWYDYTDNCIIGQPRHDGTSGRWVLRMTYGKPQLVLQTNGGAWVEANGNTVLTGGLWHQVAAKIYGGSDATRKVEFYVDGVKTNEASLSAANGAVNGVMGVHIGTWSDTIGERWSDQFIGEIDAIRISTGADAGLLPTPVQTIAPVNIAHTGMNNPDNESLWRLCDEFYAKPATASVSAAPGSGEDPDSWRIQEQAESAAFYREVIDPLQITEGGDWVASATMKLGASNKPWNCALVVEDGRNSWVMNFIDSSYVDGGNDPGAAGAGVYKSGAWLHGVSYQTSHFNGVAKMGTVDPTDGFHDYRMEYDATTDSVTFYVDDVAVGTQTRAETWARGNDAYQSTSRFFFGDSYPVFQDIDYFRQDGASDAYWANVTLESGSGKLPQYQPYDVNEDGFVGADDLDVVRAHWGESGPGGKAIGDINLDEFVGADDLDQLRAHWGEVCPPVPGLVPEPSTLALLAMGGLILLIRRRMR